MLSMISTDNKQSGTRPDIILEILQKIFVLQQS